MSWDDLEPKTKKPQPVDLSMMSIEDLTTRIAEHEAEKSRDRRETEAAQLGRRLLQTKAVENRNFTR
jgi:hypothetical protein